TDTDSDTDTDTDADTDCGNCLGPCQSCNLPGFEGTCTQVGAGADDPSGICKDAGETDECGTTGKCTADGECAYKLDANASYCKTTCDQSTGYYTELACDSTERTCSVPGTPVQCPAGDNQCLDATQCEEPCAEIGACASEDDFCCLSADANIGWCESAEEGNCVRKKTAGTECKSADGAARQCATSLCEDGVCCVSGGCSGDCSVCHLSGTGECLLYNDIVSPKAPADLCDKCFGCNGASPNCESVTNDNGNIDWNNDCDAGADPCGQNGECDLATAGECAFKQANDTECVPKTCTTTSSLGTENWSTCDNHVCTPHSNDCDTGYGCTGNACTPIGGCGTVDDTRCIIETYYCCTPDDNTGIGCTQGNCTGRIPQGIGCSEDHQCATTFVCSEDNVCCNLQCEGECAVCNGSAPSTSTGVCSSGAAVNNWEDPVYCDLTGIECHETCQGGTCTMPSSDSSCDFNCSTVTRYRQTGEANGWLATTACESAVGVDGGTGTCNVPGLCKTDEQWCDDPTSGWSQVVGPIGEAGVCQIFQNTTCEETSAPNVQDHSGGLSCDDEKWCTIDDECGTGDGVCNGDATCNDGTCTEGDPGFCNCSGTAGWTGEYCEVCVLYVDASATGANNGSSWTDAYVDLQVAFDEAVSHTPRCEVWVASDIYYVFSSSTSDTLQLRGDVEVYGGFEGGAGGETERDQRKPKDNPTVISGHGDDTHSNQVLHVVTCSSASGCNDNSVLDGFVVAGGNAATASSELSSSVTGNKGGGMLIRGVSPTISNCVFVDNSAYIRGGAVSILDDSWPVFSKCVFSNNRASGHVNAGGGALFLYGGASSVDLVNTIFAGNTAQLYGGALDLEIGLSETGTADLTGCVVAGNTAYHSGATYTGGGGIYLFRVPATITNSTFYGNWAQSWGGAVFASQIPGGIVLRNSIMWNDSAPDYEISLFNNATAVVTYSDVEDGCDASGCNDYTLGTNYNIQPPSDDPTFKIAPSNGYWEGVTYNSTTFPYYQTQLQDDDASWSENDLEGLFVQPLISDSRMFLIVTNTEKTITIWGNVSDFVSTTKEYALFDLHLDVGSPCINAANSAVAPSSDIEDYPRVGDADIGAYEYQ
ncbi:MAG: hypothetical protein GY854_25980, partial [Deltaproteobacteria bacterium]|nr:hypothetical protein [Deltaproteobacteria bacterium]